MPAPGLVRPGVPGQPRQAVPLGAADVKIPPRRKSECPQPTHGERLVQLQPKYRNVQARIRHESKCRMTDDECQMTNTRGEEATCCPLADSFGYNEEIMAERPTVEFWKLSGSGNDFICIDNTGGCFDGPAERHRGGPTVRANLLRPRTRHRRRRADLLKPARDRRGRRRRREVLRSRRKRMRTLRQRDGLLRALRRRDRPGTGPRAPHPYPRRRGPRPAGRLALREGLHPLARGPPDQPGRPPSTGTSSAAITPWPACPIW